MTLLRQRMIEDMQINGLSASRIGKFLSGFSVGLLWVIVAVLWSEWDNPKDKQ
jgi:hypothetical protein